MIFFIKTSSGQSNVGGGIFADTTWDLAGSPYIVTSNVIVYPNVTLTISPGVTVKFNLGLNMEVRGHLIAIGTNNDSIFFTTSLTNPTQSSWYNLIVNDTTTFSYISLTFCHEGLKPLGAGVYLKVDHSSFYNNDDGIYGIGYNNGIVTYCDFKNNTQYSISSGSSGLGLISNCNFIGNQTGLGGISGGLVSNCTFSNNYYGMNSTSGTYTGNTFTNNYEGCYLHSSNNFVFQNNFISNNTIGMELTGNFNNPISGFSQNTICNNSNYNVKNIGPSDFDLTNNCWCTNDSLQIANSIFDAHDSLPLGLVYFSPYINNCSLRINEAFDNQEIKTYPNPFRNFFKIESFSNEKTEVVIFDLLSSKIYYEKFQSSLIINTEKWSEGIYFYRFKNLDGNITTGKLLKN